MSRVVRCIGNVLVALAILALSFFFLGPRLMGMDFFTIYSGSMDPALPVGSVIIVRSVEASHIKVGDIIAFKTGTRVDETVVHRVVEVINGSNSISFRTAGDDNTTPDGSAVLAENIVGQGCFHLPFLGYISDFVRTKLGCILFIGVPAIFIISLETKNIITELRLMKKSQT